MAVDGFVTGVYVRQLTTGDGRSLQRHFAANLPADGPVKVIREDPKNPNLLFAGTEFALWVSTDRGARWARFGGLPTVAIDDMDQPYPRDCVSSPRTPVELVRGRRTSRASRSRR